MTNHKIDFSFAQRLDRLMVERNLYPSDVERLTGIKKRRVYEYVQGRRMPSAYVLKRFAAGLNVSADWLLGLEK